MKILLSVGSIVLSAFCWAQQPPTVNNPPSGGTNNPNFWSRAGNTNNNGSNNIFGTRWNSPIYFITGGLTQQTYRMRLNGDFLGAAQYPVNGFGGGAINTSGYLGLGFNTQQIWSQNGVGGGAAGPFSLLHLNGRDQGFVQDFGFRPWMKTGITLTDNQDLSYMGLRQIGDGPDITETTITWSDNPNNASGPDDMTFRFTGGGAAQGAGNYDNNNLSNTTDLDGLHVARYTGEGLYALGNTFGVNAGGATAYVRPQSLFHMSHTRQGGGANERWGFMQITYRNNSPGGGETEDDGLRLGIDNQVINGGLNAYLRWQEETPFIIQTDWNNNAGGIQNGERMRISSINAPGVPNPANLPNNITRVSISHAGNDPITEPRSLLHLGYNTGGLIPGTDDGWRSWMDVGTFTAQGTDNMYVGLKTEPSNFPLQPDRYDAVVNWGDNQAPLPGASVGPDNLRFIFTSTTGIGAGDPISQSQDGLEVARMDPRQASTLTDNFGMVGIGNFHTNNPNTPAPIDAKLDIDGDLRIRQVEQDNSLTRVLVIDPNDENRVHWTDMVTGTNGLACWDLNGNGVFDVATEDFDGDLQPSAGDCQGPIGPQGPIGMTGLTGATGATGPSGLACWDLNENGVFDVATEDADGDGQPSIGDCQLEFNAHNGTSLSTLLPNHVAFGQNVGQVGDPGELLNDREVPMSDQNLYFTDDNATTIGKNRIGVGTTVPQGRFHVKTNDLAVNNGKAVVIDQNNTGGGNSQGIDMNITGDNSPTLSEGLNMTVSGGQSNLGQRVQVDVNTTTGFGDQNTGLLVNTRNGSSLNRGILIDVQSPNNPTTITSHGVQARARDARNNYGGEFTATGTALVGASIENYGVRARSEGVGQRNYGVFTTAVSPTPGATSYGIWAQGNSFGTTNTAFAGWFQGNVNVTGGTLTVNGAPVITSDQMFKENINNLDSAMQIINALQPRTFTMDTLAYPEFGFESDLQMGLVAQEVEQVLPNIVSEQIRPAQFDSLGNITAQELAYKGVEYEELIPVLIAGMQEQQDEIESKDSLITDLNDRLTTLENCLSNLLPVLCDMNNRTVETTPNEVQEELRNIIDVELSDKNNIVLNQNVPNPFAERTTITYTIPESVMQAQIIFYDGSGNLINTVDIDERGDGQLNVFASDLSTGVYTYSLVADGRVVMTKKMMKQ